jgi:hypothetical protein
MNLFNVDEEVIIKGVVCKSFDGMDATVTFVSNKKMHMINGYFGYVYKTNLDTNPSLSWLETSLRKKHKPSTESLSTIIKKLNTKEKATCD